MVGLVFVAVCKRFGLSLFVKGGKEKVMVSTTEMPHLYTTAALCCQMTAISLTCIAVLVVQIECTYQFCDASTDTSPDAEGYLERALQQVSVKVCNSSSVASFL